MGLWDSDTMPRRQDKGGALRCSRQHALPHSLTIRHACGRISSRFHRLGGGRYEVQMQRRELASAMTLVDCPNCGTAITVPYLQIRIQKAAACRCGILIIIDDDTPPSVMRSLIVRAGLMNAAND